MAAGTVTVRKLVGTITYAVDRGSQARAEGSAEAVKGRIERATQSMTAFQTAAVAAGQAMQAAFSIFFGARILKFFTTDVSTAADEAAKMGKALGIGAEAYQELGFAAELSGSKIDELTKGMAQIGKRARDATQGQKAQKDAFKELGISVTKADGTLKNQLELLDDVADAFARMPDGTQKSALAMTIMGRAGIKLIPLLNEGSKGIARMRAEARSLGIVVGKNAAKASEAFNDELLRAKSVLKGVRNQVAAQLLPAFTRGLKAFQQWAKQSDRFSLAMTLLKWAVIGTVAALAGLAAVQIGSAMASMVRAVVAGVTALVNLNRALVVTRLRMLAVGVLIALLFLAIEDLVAFMRGDVSVLGNFLSAEGAKTVREVIGDLVKAAKELWASLKGPLKELWRAAVPLVKALWALIKPLLPVIGKLAVFLVRALTGVVIGLRLLIEAFASFLGWVRANVIEPMVGAFRDAFDAIAGAFESPKAAVLTVLGAIFWFLDVIKRGLKWIATHVGGPIVAGFLAVWSVLKKIWGFFKSNVTAAFEAASRVLKSIWDAIAKAISVVMRGVRAAGKLLSGDFSGAAGELGLFGQDESLGNFTPSLSKADLAGLQGGRGTPRAFPGGPGPRAPVPVLPPAVVAAGSRVSQDNRVGTVNVNVTGTTDMDDEQLREAVGNGLRDWSTDRARDLRETLR